VSAAVSAPRESLNDGWLGGRRYDLLFLFGGSGLAFVVGALLVCFPAAIVPAWWLWLLFLDGPHLLATWQRTYADADERVARRRLLVFSLLAFTPGFIAWGAMKATGERWPFDLFLLTATLWAFHHALRQNWGIVSIYQRSSGAGPGLRAFDKWFLHLSLWALYLVFVLGNAEARNAMHIPAYPATAVWIVGGLICLATAVYAASIPWRMRAGIGARPAVFILFAAVAIQVFALFVVGAFEPLIPNPMNTEQVFLAAGLVGGLSHGLQYLGIVFAANRRRYATKGDFLVARLGRSPWKSYGVLVVCSLSYIAVNVARGGTPQLAPFGVDSDTALLALALYWGAFFHHYWIDQKIWHVQSDPRLRAELGMAS
jgi:hypothetical protein